MHIHKKQRNKMIRNRENEKNEIIYTVMYNKYLYITCVCKKETNYNYYLFYATTIATLHSRSKI
jgi:hypothetical protein